MHLTKLELQGFKTFAKKTTLTFPGPKKNTYALTSIVGPNGSGKSNLADAIRWVLGEQSLKLLRGKSSEDVIFAGAAGKTRAGFAEVNLTFNNEDKSMPVEFSEVTITRRLYRDGSSEYLVNNAKSRLSDIQLLLAQANVGQRSYSVIGQGMIDHILISTPEERKAFFDDATGVKQFQMKRHQAVLKLKRTHQNLEEAETILRELSPRLRSLKRQVSRLEQRESIEADLKNLQKIYYGRQWHDLLANENTARTRFDAAKRDAQQAREKMEDLENQLEAIAKAEVETTEDGELQKKYRELQKERSILRDEEFRLQKEIELSKVRQQSQWAPLPLPDIIKEVKDMNAEQQGLLAAIKKAKSAKTFETLETSATSLFKRSKVLLSKLERPAPEDIKPDKKLTADLDKTRKTLKTKQEELAKLEQAIDAQAKESKKERTQLFEIQKKLRNHQGALYKLESARNEAQIELARIDERKTNLDREMNEELKELKASVQKEPPAKSDRSHSETYADIQKLKYKLELIGGIDEETIKEYEEIQERHAFLDEQVTDLQSAIKDTEKIIDELDEKISKQSEKVFKQINEKFETYFKGLFGGGSAKLVKLTAEDLKNEEPTEVTPERAQETAGEVIAEEDAEALEEAGVKPKTRKNRVVGIDIQATPPGKKLKALNLLSGGERALTSIALLSAIMATNPAPFVVLDEVDAALDEANTVRFATILDELRKLSQFIIITHNRATMERADIIYGVTMGDDGISNLLSVNLEDIAEGGTARR